MARYIDGFILAVPKDNLNAYKRMARLAGKVWREHGALEYVECWADDAPPGKLTSFPQSVMLKDDEAVVFAYIVYPSRKARDKINALVMKDPRLKDSMESSSKIFDGKRMIYGGFKEIVSLGTAAVAATDAKADDAKA